MSAMNGLYQSADWKSEKHVPVIEIVGGARADAPVTVKVSVGREIPHPNKTEHHIAWIDLYFLPAGEKLPFQVGRTEFSAHGASVKGPDTSGVYAEPSAVFTFRPGRFGELLAASYCNIHGLWQGAAPLALG